MILKVLVVGYSLSSTILKVSFLLRSDDNSVSDGTTITVSSPAFSDSDGSIKSAVNTAITNYCNTNIGQAPDIIDWFAATPTDLAAAAPATLVAGAAKTGTYAVMGTPAVAGGAGVARFYIDSVGDGSGTAPSEVYTASLQAVVFNTTLGYVPQSVTVDASRKYIDVKMGTLSFSGLTLLGQTVLGSQSIANAANGTVVNCFVIVKK